MRSIISIFEQESNIIDRSSRVPSINPNRAEGLFFGYEKLKHVPNFRVMDS